MNKKYNEFITFLFDRDEAKGEWRWEEQEDEQPEPELTRDETAEFIAQMFENYKSDLAHFSNWQLGLGFDYLFNTAFSDYSLIIQDAPTDITKRIAAIKSLKTLFRDCINERCSKTLGHLSEPGNDLNKFCYMLWEVNSIGHAADPFEADIIYPIVTEVMAFCLTLDNISCVESGLHGLGHLGLCYYPKAHEVIKDHIKAGTFTDPRLLKYAHDASDGRIE